MFSGEPQIREENVYNEHICFLFVLVYIHVYVSLFLIGFRNLTTPLFGSGSHITELYTTRYFLGTYRIIVWLPVFLPCESMIFSYGGICVINSYERIGLNGFAQMMFCTIGTIDCQFPIE